MKTKIVGFVFLLLLLGSIGTAVYLFRENQKAKQEIQQLKKNENKMSQAEADEIIARVSKLIDLPKDERPSIGTVSDKSALKNQPFFAKAQNGDRLLIYSKAKRVILYRPSANKIIEVGTINVTKNDQDQNQNVQFQTTSPSPALRQATPVPTATTEPTKAPTTAISPTP